MTESLRLRPTTSADLPFVLRAEQHPDNCPFVEQWTLEEHTVALTHPDICHCILERQNDGVAVGYLILVGITSYNQSVEFLRLVVTEKGQGYGQQAVRLVQAYAFEELRVHRLYLDAVEGNGRARHIYEKLGFVYEGTLRECFKTQEGYQSLIMMSMLEQEYLYASS